MREAQSTASTRHLKKTTARHVKIKLLKTSNKEKILKAGREKRHFIQRSKELTEGFLLKTIRTMTRRAASLKFWGKDLCT